MRYFNTLDEVNDIVSRVFMDDSNEYIIWNEMSDNNKQVILNNSTDIIESLRFVGYRKSIGQELQFPRIIDGIEFNCPKGVKTAIVIQGIRDTLNRRKEETELKGLGVKNYKIEGASIEFFEKDNSKTNGNIYTDLYNMYLERWVY